MLWLQDEMLLCHAGIGVLRDGQDRLFNIEDWAFAPSGHDNYMLLPKPVYHDETKDLFRVLVVGIRSFFQGGMLSWAESLSFMLMDL